MGKEARANVICEMLSSATEDVTLREEAHCLFIYLELGGPRCQVPHTRDSLIKGDSITKRFTAKFPLSSQLSRTISSF